MKKTTRKVGARFECGMVSLQMFQIPKSKALIIAYLDLRSGLKKYTFNKTDIIRQTDIGDTVVRQCMKELVAEGVLNRKGKSFYKVNRQRMEELYYTVSESDLIESDSDACLSESDTDVSESDSDVSESDAIHSSILDSRKIDSSELHTKEVVAVATSGHDWRQLAAEEQSDATLPQSPVDRFDKFILPETSPTVSGTPPVPLEKVSLTLSGRSGLSVILAPEISASEAPPAIEIQKDADSVGQTTATKSAASAAPAPVKKYSPEYFRQMAVEQNRNMRLYGSPFGRR